MKRHASCRSYTSNGPQFWWGHGQRPSDLHLEGLAEELHGVIGSSSVGEGRKIMLRPLTAHLLKEMDPMTYVCEDLRVVEANKTGSPEILREPGEAGPRMRVVSKHRVNLLLCGSFIIESMTVLLSLKLYFSYKEDCNF